jgi:hypothetical protein
MVNPLFGLICPCRSNIIDRLLNWAAFSQNNNYQIVSVISLLLIHGLTAYLVGEEFIQCLVDVLMRWTLGSEPTSVPIEHDMHSTIAAGIGFWDREEGVRQFKA